MRDRFVLAATALCLLAFAAAFLSFRVGALAAAERAPATAADKVADKVGPACDHAEVVRIALRPAGESHVKLRARDGATWSQREGQSTRGHRLEAIELDRVVLSHEGALCELRVGASPPADKLAMR
jgi:hypothetical protein